MRLERLRKTIVEHGLEGMLITDPLNRRYLSGFSGTAGWLLVTAERAMLAVDFRYYERAERESPGWEQVHVTDTYPATLVEMVAEAGISRLGIEGDHVTVAQFAEMQAKVPDVTFTPIEKAIHAMRAIKDEDEV